MNRIKIYTKDSIDKIIGVNTLRSLIFFKNFLIYFFSLFVHDDI